MIMPLFQDIHQHDFLIRINLADFQLDSLFIQLLERLDILIVNRNGACDLMLAFMEAHAANIDALDVHAMLDHVQHTRRIRKQQQAALILIFRIVVDTNRFFQINNMRFDAGRCNLLEQRSANRIICYIIIANDNALAVRYLRPYRGYLPMDQTVINSC